MIHINGSNGEGGGQIVRSSLALSMVTGKPFKIDQIRAGRKKPGLMRQHLTATRAAAEICDAKLEGDDIGSTAITFTPGSIKPGEYEFAIGTAGSTTLVLQTILPALLLADAPSVITLKGGTHNPFAPPFDFLEKAFLPLINQMGPQVEVELIKPGFYPAGGGELVVRIEPAKSLKPLHLHERGELKHRHAQALVSNLPADIAKRELRRIETKLGWQEDELESVIIRNSPGPGNILTLTLSYEHVTEVFTGFGEPGRSCEAVAGKAIQQCQHYLKSQAPVGEYLTDQIMLPLAIAGEGSFTCLGLSRHATTHLELIQQFLEVDIQVKVLGNQAGSKMVAVTSAQQRRPVVKDWPSVSYK